MIDPNITNACLYNLARDSEEMLDNMLQRCVKFSNACMVFAQSC